MAKPQFMIICFGLILIICVALLIGNSNKSYLESFIGWNGNNPPLNYFEQKFYEIDNYVYENLTDFEGDFAEDHNTIKNNIMSFLNRARTEIIINKKYFIGLSIFKIPNSTQYDIDNKQNLREYLNYVIKNKNFSNKYNETINTVIEKIDKLPTAYELPQNEFQKQFDEINYYIQTRVGDDSEFQKSYKTTSENIMTFLNAAKAAAKLSPPDITALIVPNSNEYNIINKPQNLKEYLNYVIAKDFDEKYVKIFEEIIAKIDGLSVDKINENVSDYSVYETLFGSVTNNFAIIRI